VINLLVKFNFLTIFDSAQSPFNIGSVTVLDWEDGEIRHWIVICCGWMFINVINQGRCFILSCGHFQVNLILLFIQLSELEIASHETSVDNLAS
jgi:hypothetical protein